MDERPDPPLRDYGEWHRAYDDPDSGLSWRLAEVRRRLDEALDQRPGDVRLVSSCSGDGRDVLSVLADRTDSHRVSATLVEIHPTIAQRARDRARALGLDRVEVRTADAGVSDAFVDAVPADVVLLVGVLGNISDADLERTVHAAPQLCSPGATLIWSRGREVDDRNELVRRWFAEAGFTEVDYVTREGDSRPALGVQRLVGEPQSLVGGQRWFTFIR